jgi:hypothetical protein
MTYYRAPGFQPDFPMALAKERFAAAHPPNRLPSPTAGSQPHTFPGVAELAMAHTLRAVAGDDGEMQLWALDIG